MPPQRSLRILLVEDNPVNQMVAQSILARRGHTVVTADNGRAALELLEGEPFDVALMDVQMPVMDGLEATAAIRDRERGAGRHLPILALTANAQPDDRERCLRAGMDGYLTKPVQSHLLYRSVEAAAGLAAPGA
jgi:CheY-like chemotaxis protein